MKRTTNPLEKEFGTHGTAQEVSNGEAPVDTLFVEQNVTQILKHLAGFAKFAARFEYPVDEYDIQTLVPAVTNTLTLQPTYEFSELIESVLITGPTTQVTSTELSSSATAPGVNGNVVNFGILPKGQYQILWSVGLASGAPAAGDADNMKLTLGNTVETAAYPGAIGQYPQEPVFITADGVTGMFIKAVAAATAGVVYEGQINAIPVSPAFQLQLGSRVFNLTLPPSGAMVLAPLNLSLDRTDPRTLTSTVPGDWMLELMGWGDVRRHQH